MAKTKSKNNHDDRSLVHIRVPEDVLEAVDQHAAELETEARKIAPKISISRGDAIVSILKSALDQKRLRESMKK